jgi:hypothetical protein
MRENKNKVKKITSCGKCKHTYMFEQRKGAKKTPNFVEIT